MTDWTNPTGRGRHGSRTIGAEVKEAVRQTSVETVANVFVLNVVSCVESDPSLQSLKAFAIKLLSGGADLREVVLQWAMGPQAARDEIKELLLVLIGSDDAAAVTRETSAVVIHHLNKIRELLLERQADSASSPAALPVPAADAVEPKTASGDDRGPLTSTLTISAAAALAHDQFQAGPLESKPRRPRRNPASVNQENRPASLKESTTREIVALVENLAKGSSSLVTLASINADIERNPDLKARIERFNKSFISVGLVNHCVRFGKGVWWPSSLALPAATDDFRTVTMPSNKATYAAAKVHLDAYNAVREKAGLPLLQGSRRTKTPRKKAANPQQAKLL